MQCGHTNGTWEENIIVELWLLLKAIYLLFYFLQSKEKQMFNIINKLVIIAGIVEHIIFARLVMKYMAKQQHTGGGSALTNIEMDNPVDLMIWDRLRKYSYYFHLCHGL